MFQQNQFWVNNSMIISSSNCVKELPLFSRFYVNSISYLFFSLIQRIIIIVIIIINAVVLQISD